MNEPKISQENAESRDVSAGEGAWQEKARAFSRARLRLYGLRTLLGLLFPFLFWYLGWSAGLEAALGTVVPQRWLLVPLFLLAYQAAAALVFLPLAYFGGFLLQHRFGLSRQNLSGWVADWAKTTAIGTIFFLVGLGAFYLLLAASPDHWWWILALALSLVALLLTYVAPVVLLPIFYKSSPVEDQELAGRIQRLADRAGTRISKVRTIDMSRRTVAANAALTGIGRTRQVLLGDTLLQQFTPEEVETVVAHELGHHVHGDIWKGLVVEIAGIWAGLAALQWLVRPAFLAGGLGDISVLANLPPLILLGEVAFLALMPVANGVSRRYEAQADAFAVRLSGMPEAYSAALYRLARQNLAELWPPRWVEVLLYSHPAIGRRMNMVRRIH